MDKMTRKELAAHFGVDYQTMVNALRGMAPRKRMPGHLFDVETARDALVQKLQRSKDLYVRRMQDIDDKIADIKRR